MRPVIIQRLALGLLAPLSLAACGGTAGDAGPDSAAAAAPPVQAISFLGDTLRALPLSADTKQRYEAQLAEAQAAYERADTNADSIVWYARRLGYLGRFRETIDV